MTGRGGQAGQAFPLVVFVAAALCVGGLGTFWLGRAHAGKAHAQTAADLTALSAGRRLRELLPASAGVGDGERAGWRTGVEAAARTIAARNGVRLMRVDWPPSTAWPPTSVQVTVAAPGPAGTEIPATARAAIVSGQGTVPDAASSGPHGQYAGPLVTRDGRPMCPAVAAAYDRMSLASRAAGVRLTVTSGFRTDAEQAVLFARHPDPTWVAPPGRSRHRHATELDIAGSAGAWTWLGRNARRYGFVQRYSWEPWHYGYLPGCGPARHPQGDPTTVAAALPGWVPATYRGAVLRGARVGGVPPIILAALLRAESGFDPRATSRAGAQGIAQFLPATARGMGLADPFDPLQAIPAAARLLGAHLRTFGSIPLALAAYNAGPAAVVRSHGVPPYPETRAYVTRIMALAGDPTVGTDRQIGSGGVILVRADGLLV